MKKELAESNNQVEIVKQESEKIKNDHASELKNIQQTQDADEENKAVVDAGKKKKIERYLLFDHIKCTDEFFFILQHLKIWKSENL